MTLLQLLPTLFLAVLLLVELKTTRLTHAHFKDLAGRYNDLLDQMVAAQKREARLRECLVQIREQTDILVRAGDDHPHSRAVALRCIARALAEVHDVPEEQLRAAEAPPSKFVN